MESLFKRLLDFYHIDEDDYQKLIADVDEFNFADNHAFNNMDACVALVKKAVAENKKIFHSVKTLADFIERQKMDGQS